MTERVYVHAVYQGLYERPHTQRAIEDAQPWVDFHSHAWESLATHAQPALRCSNFRSYEWTCISAPQKSRCSAPSSIPRRAS